MSMTFFILSFGIFRSILAALDIGLEQGGNDESESCRGDQLSHRSAVAVRFFRVPAEPANASHPGQQERNCGQPGARGCRAAFDPGRQGASALGIGHSRQRAGVVYARAADGGVLIVDVLCMAAAIPVSGFFMRLASRPTIRDNARFFKALLPCPASCSPPWKVSPIR